LEIERRKEIFEIAIAETGITQLRRHFRKTYGRQGCSHNVCLDNTRPAFSA